MSRSDNFPIKKTGNPDNERVQINKALGDIFDTLVRSGQWDDAVTWGDHNKAGYATELTETEQFEALGVPQNLQLTEEIVVSANGTERNTVEATWLKVPDDNILYDLEIRQSDPATVIDATDSVDILDKTTMFTVAIVGNEEADSNITFNIFLDGGVRYWFRLRIRKDSLVSPWTDFENVTTSLATAQPDPPQSLTIEPIIEGALVKWTIPTDRAIIEKTRVYRREVGQTTNPVVAEVAKPGNTFTDGDLSSSITYEYKVASVSFRDVESNPTGWISVQPLPVEADFVIPDVPANLSATQELVTDNTGGQAFVTIDVSWDVVSGDNITYDLDIVRGGSVQVNTPVISNPASGSTVNYEFQVPVGTVLAIKVRSRNATSVSAFTATLNITANADATGVDAVGNLQAKPLYQGALVSWDNPTNVNYKYAIVERRRTAPSFVDYVEIGKVVRPSSFLFDDVGELSLDANDNVANLYDYRVTGYSSANEPGPSMVKEDIKPLNVPPDSITADQIVANTITAQEIKGSTITAEEIDVDDLTANNVFISNVKTTVTDLGVKATFIQTSEPTQRIDGSPLQVGDVWYDTTLGEGDKPYTYKGVSLGWVPAYTVIDGGNIITGSIEASKLDVTQLSAITANLGTITAGTITLDEPAGGFISSGQTAYDTGTGFFLGNSGGTPVFSLGNSAGNKILWNGSNFTVNGKLIDGQTNIVDGSLRANDITTGTLDASQITVSNLSASSINTGTLNAALLNVINLNAGSITTGTLDAQDVDVINLDAEKITTGTLSANRIGNSSLSVTKLEGTLKSDNFDSSLGTDGWRIERSGNVILNDLVARGDLIAGAGTPNRVEIVASGSGDDADYVIWAGSFQKNAANGRFWVDKDGNAKFGGRVSAAQLEGAVFDGVPINITGSTITNSSSTTWVTVANQYVEVPETIQRPRRPFVSLVVPVFGSGSVGAWVRCQIAIQASNGNYGSFFTIGQEYTQDTTSVGAAAPIAIGSTSTGTRGFRVRVQFRAAVNGEPAQANRWSGLFIALPASSGFVIRNDSTGGAVSTTPSDPSILVPPNFGDGWIIP